ncbi:MAG: SAM-dependent methyltransferase [Sphingomonas sp. SCN 67-18]|nr:class I SAM-dependent methyltransferase [Sphingomonas sp. SCN 67-18]ODU15445.1 MAG: SAM-dependent methyltransferase [Sphingomonas sp. SCN 67-18]
MWDQRYSGSDYVFGVEPNRFLTSCGHLLEPGQTALAVADGEGRNSVWLASQGLSVTAFDASNAGLSKARQLAAEKRVAVDHRLSQIEDWEWRAECFDVVVAIFIQFAAPELRSVIFEGMKRTLKPGGLILMEGYRPEQIAYATGGPRQREQLYTRGLLEEAFADFEILQLAEHDSELHEGQGHSGMSALIDLVARKPPAPDA